MLCSIAASSFMSFYFLSSELNILSTLLFSVQLR